MNTFQISTSLVTECLVWQFCFFNWILTECHISCGWPTGDFAWHSLHNHLIAAAWLQVVSELPHCWLSTHATYWSLTTDTDWNLILVKFTVEWTYNKYVITKTKNVQMFVPVSLLPLSLCKCGTQIQCEWCSFYISHFTILYLLLQLQDKMESAK